MILTVFSSKEKKDKKVRLALIQHGDVVTVTVVDRLGKRVECGSLITFYSDGSVKRNACVSGSFGFDLTADGQLVID